MDYIELVLKSSFGKSDAFAFIALAVLVLCRIMPIITLAPFFGSRVLPHPVKVALALSLFVVILPQLLIISTPNNLLFNQTLCMLCLKELFIGIVLGFFLGLPFLIVSSAGVYIDHQRGAASLMVNDPALQNQSSPIGTLYNFILIVLFFNIGGFNRVIDAILDSYTLVPPDQFINPLFFEEKTAVKEKLITALQVFVTLSLQLSAPALVVLLMTDSFLGIINRLAPQVQITFLGMGLKSWLGILMVAIGWFVLVEQFAKELNLWLTEFQKLIPDFYIGHKRLISS